MTLVLLVRHGRTDANARGVLAGRTPGVALDGVGRRQARSLGTRLRGIPIDALVHSPLERCAQTADAIRAARESPVATHVDERLAECDYGEWSGRVLADLKKEPLWASVQQRPSTVVFPGGESMAHMAARSVDAVRDWTERHPDGVVVLVTHGDIIKAILSDALGQPLDRFQRIATSPGSLSVIGYGHGDPLVMRMNDVGRPLRLPKAPARPALGGGGG